MPSRSDAMKMSSEELVIVRVPEELAPAVGCLREATGRDDFDIVTSALRTYLADERQRAAVVAHFSVTPTGYPAAYVVTARARLQGGAVFDDHSRARAEVTFGQINRFRLTQLHWGVEGDSVVVELAVSGQTSDQAAGTAVKMVRSRIIDELGLATDDGLEVEVTDTYDLLYG
jgi:hypothetical protein